jgi:molybdate transport system substrate-binding protein
VPSRNHRLAVAAVVSVLALAALATVAGRASATPRAHDASPAQITVYAAASLTDVFPKIDSSPRYSFAGSNALATQITLGAPADVFASANLTLPNQLFLKGVCSQPVVFTRNTLVIVVPKANPKNIHSVYDLAKSGVKIVVAGPGVPVGSYTLQILKNMSLTAAVTKNIVSQETDVREVLAKVALDEGDAGFVYATDAKTVPKKVRVITIPPRGRPTIEYGICVVLASHNKPAAQAFVRRILGPAGQRILRRYGFLPRRP